MSWIELGKTDQFSSETQVVNTEIGAVLVANLNGSIVVADAKCPHAGSTLERADLESNIVTCPLHGWRFDMADGCKEIHGYEGLTMRDVKVENGLVYIAA